MATELDVTASTEGVARLEPCEAWRPYIVAAIPRQVTLSGASTERKTGAGPAIRARAIRTLSLRDGGLDLLRRAA